jgi:putative aminopeptidase FrvX
MYKYLDPYQNGHPTTHSMQMERLNRVKSVLSIPSTYQHEQMVTDYIVKFCDEQKLPYIVDNLGSVLITKGKPKEGDEYYPLIGAHMDTVHNMVVKEIVENKNILTAWNNGEQVGIGGDDLAGVAICLELLLIMPILKVGFFVSEEVGCIGSRNVIMYNRDWFNDVGYMIEFDGPEDYMVTKVCSGVELFDPDGEFISKSLPLLMESMGDKMRFFEHPYTDVSVIKRNFNFSCINISAGYFNWHSHKEYVVISEVEKAIILGEKMITELKYNQYNHINQLYENYKNKK